MVREASPRIGKMEMLQPKGHLVHPRQCRRHRRSVPSSRARLRSLLPRKNSSCCRKFCLSFRQNFVFHPLNPLVRVFLFRSSWKRAGLLFHRATLTILAYGATPDPGRLGSHPSQEQAGVALLRREGAWRFCLQKGAGEASRGLQLAGWLMGRAPAWHREGAPGSGAMEAPRREDALQSSWVEVPLPGQEEPPTPACAPHRDMERILLEAQLEMEPPRAEGSFLALKAPGVEDLSPRQREEAEGSVQLGNLPWSWPSPPEHQKELACLPPACAPLLSPVLHRRRGLRDPQLLLLVIPSLLLSHVLALGLGICIGKRLAASTASSL